MVFQDPVTFVFGYTSHWQKLNPKQEKLAGRKFGKIAPLQVLAKKLVQEPAIINTLCDIFSYE